MDELRTTTVDGGATGRAYPTSPAPTGVHIPQLTRRGVLGVWAAATVPMGLLAWVVAPLVADQLSGPGALARALMAALTIGLVWQFVLVVVLVRREQGTLRWPVVREALWLRVVEERSYGEIADALDISEQTARARVSRGLRSLGRALDATAVVPS